MKISLHIEREHTCGQLFEEVLTLNGFDMNLSQEMIPYPQEEVDLTKPFVMPESPPRQVAFSGTYERMDITGMGWLNRRGFYCLRCGEDLLFGKEVEKEEDEL